ncbi:glycosyltransferase family 2 protein [Candidatus Saccharibacteria bacterium]|nr:MAG: glycosyltransferase family 2 protein [Candidatus Saccharibacteria bacterium]
MDKPKISVVMSAYNAQEYLEEAIESILNQTFNDFEFIIIDDGSTDNTSAIIENYARQDSRIRPVDYGENKGLITALNTGFKMAKGRYIARMDADDISLPDRFLKQYEYLEAHPDTVLLGTLSAYMDERSQVYGIWPVLLSDEEIRTGIAIHNEFRHGAVMIRRDVITKNKELYDIKAAHYEDYEYWPRLLRHGKGANLPDVLYLYREISTNITATKGAEMDAGSDHVVSREQSLLKLPPVRIKKAFILFRRAGIYKPASVTVNGTRLRTNLRWQYQLFLLGLSKLYIHRKDPISAAYSILACILINPFRFAYSGALAFVHGITGR